LSFVLSSSHVAGNRGIYLSLSTPLKKNVMVTPAALVHTTLAATKNWQIPPVLGLKLSLHCHNRFHARLTHKISLPWSKRHFVTLTNAAPPCTQNVLYAATSHFTQQYSDSMCSEVQSGNIENISRETC
jgi:hypothetical protein